MLPVSALEGDNIVERSDRTPWYDGPALLELLEALPAQDELEPALEPFRLPVQLVLRPQGGLSPELAADDAESSVCATSAPSPGASRRARCGWATGSRSSRPASRTTVTGIQVAGVRRRRGRRPAVGLGAARRRRRRRARRRRSSRRAPCPTGRREIDAELFQLDARPLTTGARVLVKHGTATVQADRRADRVALRPRRPHPRARRHAADERHRPRAPAPGRRPAPRALQRESRTAARSSSSIRPTARHSPPASCATDRRRAHPPHRTAHLKEANREQHPHRDDDHHSGTCGR